MPGELRRGCTDPTEVGLRRWARHVLTGGQRALVSGQLIQPGQEIFEGVFVGEPRVVVAGVALNQPGMHVTVLDRAGDQTSGAAPNKPRQGAPEPRNIQPATRIQWDRRHSTTRAVVVDPADERAQINTGLGAGLPAAYDESGPTPKRFNLGRKQQILIMQPLQDRHGVGHGFHDNTRVTALGPGRDFVSIAIHRILEVPPRHQPHIRGDVMLNASPTEVEHYWWSGRIRNVRYSSA